MKSKIWKRFGVGLLATAIVVGSFAIWAHFTQKALDAEEVVRLAKEQELLDRRYPVKAGKPKVRMTPSPLPVRDEVSASPGPKVERATSIQLRGE